MAAEMSLAREVADRQVTMFTMFVGKGLHTTRAALVIASGIPDSSLREYAKGAAMPFHVVLRLARFLPREAINMLAEPGDLRFADAEERETNWDAIAAGAAGLAAQVCEARRDGNIDHVEDAQLRARTRALIAEATAAVAAG